MGLRSSGRKLSFDILSQTNSFQDVDGFPLFYRSNSDPTRTQGDSQSDVSFQNSKSRKRKKHRKKKPTTPHNDFAVIEEDPVVDDAVSSEVVLEKRSDLNCQSYVSGGGSATSVCTVTSENMYSKRELRQRNVNGSEEAEESSTTTTGEKLPQPQQQQRMSEANGSVATKLETAESLDWKRLMAEKDSNYTYSVEKSPLKYFLEAMYSGNSLQSTTTLADEKERERVYDTIFRLPWRCELLIDVGFFVCFDSFLSLLTIMPTRILITLWKLISARQFNRPSAAELCDFACSAVLACGVFLLQQTDISLIYHMIRGQGTIKLYVVYNVLEIFDKLCQSFGGDVLQTLFNSAEGLANCSEENMRFWIWRFISDQALAIVASNILCFAMILFFNIACEFNLPSWLLDTFILFHSFVLLAQAITLSTCIVAHNNALLALLVSNNFAEIKSNVFKRFSKANIHGLVYADSVERFHISAFLLFVLAQNILEAEGPWFQSFIYNALLVFMCEMLIDIIKHSFLAKFNDIKPIAYSEFLEDLCKQTLNVQTENGKKNLTFVPLAPACVVIRVLTPVFAARLPCNPVPWRLFWIVILSAVTYIMLTSLKVMIGMGLQKHATWYVKRCERRRHHLHYD